MVAEAPDLPGSLRPTSTAPFVGRAAELEKLRTLMPRSDGEGRRVALLAGEPGAGKSRLVREFAGRAASDGALVLYGACDAVVRTPYGPFVEALDRLVRVTEVDGAAGRARRRRRRADQAAARSAPTSSASCRSRLEPTPTPSAIASTRRSPTCSPISAAAGRSCSCSRTGTGRMRRRFSCSGTWPAPPGAPGCCCWRPFATPRPTCRRGSRRRSPTCAAPTTSCECASPGSPDRRSPTWSTVPPAATPEPEPELLELATAIHDLTGGNAVPRLRALARPRRDRDSRGRGADGSG